MIWKAGVGGWWWWWRWWDFKAGVTDEREKRECEGMVASDHRGLHMRLKNHLLLPLPKQP